MPKLNCVCGAVIDLSDIPAKDEYELIPEAQILDLARRASTASMTEEEILEFIDSTQRSAIICPLCKRIYLETGVGTKSYQRYMRESD